MRVLGTHPGVSARSDTQVTPYAHENRRIQILRLVTFILSRPITPHPTAHKIRLCARR